MQDFANQTAPWGQVLLYSVFIIMLLQITNRALVQSCRDLDVKTPRFILFTEVQTAMCISNVDG